MIGTSKEKYKVLYNLTAELFLPMKYVGLLQKLKHTQEEQFPAQ